MQPRVKKRYPIEHGVVKDFDDMERILRYAFFNMLRVAQEDLKAVLARFSCVEIILGLASARLRSWILRIRLA